MAGDVSGSSLLEAEPYVGRILARDLQRQHLEMCCELRWISHSWRDVARQLALMLDNGKKRWSWVSDPVTGERHRLRVYVLPAPLKVVATSQRKRLTPAPVVGQELTQIWKDAA